MWNSMDTAPVARAVLLTFAPDDIPSSDITHPGVTVAYRDEYYMENGAGYEGNSGWVEPFSGEAVELHYGPPTGWMPLPLLELSL